MIGTALLYSSHNRGRYIHNDLIVQRALGGWGDRRILFLPMSEGVQNGSELERQDFSWGNFRWYFSLYERYGLEYVPFYWTSGLQKGDVDLLWHYLWTSEVVILGGGHSRTGLWRYKELGARFDGEPGKFGRLLHERQQRGLLTVGYSAGADQLGEHLFARLYGQGGDTSGFGVARDVMTMLHYDPSRAGDLFGAAGVFPRCMVFGLPNDSGLLVDQGRLPSGNLWQVIEFIIDNSWDDPSDHHHIRTRSGALIEHATCDGRHWAFHGGDHMVRIQSPDSQHQRVFITAQGRPLDYWTQEPVGYGSIGEILGSF